MKFNIMGKKFTVNDEKSGYVKKKIGRLEKFFKTEPEARIVLGSVKDKEYVEATIVYDGILFRAEVTDSDMFSAVDKAVDIIERQIRKNKTKLEKRTKRDAFSDNTLISGEEYGDDEDADYNLVKRKRFKVKPMDINEAILQMNLLGHGFFVFKNRDTDEVNVVYKRKDGDYAVIESID